MIKRTFTHISGIGELKELHLWENGVHEWTDLYNKCFDFFDGKRADKILANLEVSMRKYEKGDLQYFYKSLPRKDLWRLLPGHEDKTAFVDIETTGLAHPPAGKVTTISVLMDGKLHQAHGDLEKRKLASYLNENAQLLVSYYGEVFDIPFLRKQFKQKFDIAHVDLCFALRRNGLSGGLKYVEKKAKIKFVRKSDGLDGFAAVIMWNMYKKGNKKALETLLAYNGEDTVVLQLLSEKLIEIEAKKIGDKSLVVDFPRLPKILPKPCAKVIKSIQKITMGERW